ncbi:hypothetical protein GCM10010915_17880 [Microbacterium faecale]|uniref:Uncharacterized protein n=1 Tax=Microbacterium faecale TaxID=1804630 RepID=A0A916YAI6_9MICO|nr:hypothetical protein [Microbacterium faecale]GGD37469.1 hypothetical protein GCM10010915_17880 [Microbacterium faecale]
MTVLAATDEAQDALLGDLRRIRRIAPPEVPLPATRATIGGETLLLVDAVDAAGWPGWSCAGAEHLAGPTDVLRRDDGHDVVLADLAETCAHACGVREEGGTGWHRGEVVTLVVSILRGVVEASQRGLADDASGGWWMTRDRRPVFVFGGDARGVAPIGEASRDLVRQIVAACDDRVVSRVCDDILVALERPEGVERAIERFEQTLFDAAAPQPVDLEPSRARGRAGQEPRVIRPEDPDPSGPTQRVRAVLENLLDARVAGIVADSMGSLARLVGRRRKRRREAARSSADGGRERNRGRVALVAGAAAMIVIAVGVLWPSDDAGRAQEQPDADARAARTTAPTPDAGKAAGPHEADKTDQTVDAARVELENERHHAALVADDPVRAARALLAGTAGLSGAAADPASDIELVDDYGAVALLAVRAAARAPQLLVIERVDGTWRVRDLYRQGSA